MPAKPPKTFVALLFFLSGVPALAQVPECADIMTTYPMSISNPDAVLAACSKAVRGYEDYVFRNPSAQNDRFWQGVACASADHVEMAGTVGTKSRLGTEILIVCSNAMRRRFSSTSR